MKKKHTPQPNEWQRTALRHLYQFAAAEGPVQDVNSEYDPNTLNLSVSITLDLTPLKPIAINGLPVQDTETVYLAIEPGEWRPPFAFVAHHRFAGHPHVLNGYALCLYLDHSREYHPNKGIAGVINRLWRWFEDATQAKFDPDTALFHAVGGVPHLGTDGPTIVVREPLRLDRRIHNAYLHKRTDRRYDLTATRRSTDDNATPVIHLDHDLPLGAGQDHLTQLLRRIDLPVLFDADRARLAVLKHRLGISGTVAAEATTQPPPDAASCDQNLRQAGRDHWNAPLVLPHAPRRPSTVLLNALAAAAAKRPNGTDLNTIITVPHPTGRYRHLLGLRLDATVADALRNAVHDRNTPTISLRASLVNPNLPMDWTRISDERDAVTQRRDTGKPVTNYTGKTIQIWGLGGLGSWIAEYVARAAPAKLILCDPALVTGGLLVRQNYTEADIGNTKADALARRLHAINDDLNIVVAPDVIAAATEHGADTDLIIDATISNAVALVMNDIASNAHTAPLVQVATDTRSGTLGLLSISAPGDTRGPNQIDEATCQEILARPELERYHSIWADPLPSDELIPVKGCSIPTFHGSAADLSAVAASLTNLIGTHLKSKRSGTHLIALPHTGVQPSHHWQAAS